MLDVGPEPERTLGVNTGDAEGDPVVEVGPSKLIAPLLHAETQLSEFRGCGK